MQRRTDDRRAGAAGNASAFHTRSGKEARLPLFLPVYDRRVGRISIARLRDEFGVDGCIVNAFLLYKDRPMRERFREGSLTLPGFLDFDGILMTDSGAFQGFSGPLYLKNKKIVAFQDMIGADIISPLDLVTPPGDSRVVATRKSQRTVERVREAFAMTANSCLAGVQQGGRFMDLRRQSLETLLEVGIEYLALGSLVPFFNRHHDLQFVGKVIAEARSLAGPDMPIHVYGAGDPVELPFLFSAGATVFDSSSYAHYAAGGWYMTRYGALKQEQLDGVGERISCSCPVCSNGSDRSLLFGDESALASHNLWTILDTVNELREMETEEQLAARLDDILEVHEEWFPESRLAASWRDLIDS